MKVGLVVERFDPLRGGLEQWTYRFAHKLVQAGHEVHLVSREFSERTRPLPMIAHRIAQARSPLAFAAAAEAALAALNLDVIHDMGVGWYCDIFHPHGGSWASTAQRKLLLLPPWLRPLKGRLNRLLPRYGQFHKLMQRQYADHGQIMVALSQTVADDFTRFHQVAPEHIRIVYNGVDAERFSPPQAASHRQTMRRSLGVGPQTLVMLIVAHNFQLKGMATLLRALARLRAWRLPLRLLVVGGKRLQGWQRMAARLGVAEAVEFLGPVENTLPYYAAADLYVHPTIYDTCSLVVLEAAACGLPIVTSRCNGAAELFHDGDDVLLLDDPGDAEELAGRVQLLSDAAARRALGEAARRVAVNHTFDRNVSNILGLYEEVMENRARLSGGPLVWSGRVTVTDGEEAPASRRERLGQMLRNAGVVR